MGVKKNTYIVEKRIYKDPKNPATSEYDVEYPMTCTEGVINSTNEILETQLQRIENWQKSIRLSKNTDLNTIITPGFYYCNANDTAKTFINLPTSANGKTTAIEMTAFSLLVEKQTGAKQTLTFYSGGSDPVETFIRIYYDYWDIWTPWVKSATAESPQLNWFVPLSGNATSRYIKTQDNIVTMQIALVLGTIKRLDTIAYLPLGFRPLFNVETPVTFYNDDTGATSAGTLYIRTTGEILFSTGNSCNATHIYTGCISFLAIK